MLMPHIVCDIRAINVGILRQSHRGTFGGRQIVTGGIPGARWRSPPADTVGGASTRIPSGMCLERLWGQGDVNAKGRVEETMIR